MAFVVLSVSHSVLFFPQFKMICYHLDTYERYVVILLLNTEQSFWVSVKTNYTILVIRGTYEPQFAKRWSTNTILYILIEYWPKLTLSEKRSSLTGTRFGRVARSIHQNGRFTRFVRIDFNSPWARWAPRAPPPPTPLLHGTILNPCYV